MEHKENKVKRALNDRLRRQEVFFKPWDQRFLREEMNYQSSISERLV